jgi:purine nucleosidase
MRQLLIDTDPGVDDALAVIMCRTAPGLQVRGLSVCGGNVGLEHTLRNALILAEQFPQAPPVYAGLGRALLARAPDAAFVHGADGFGEANLAAPTHRADPLHAALAIIAHAKACNGTLEILALGPLGNIALALCLEPNLPALVRRLTVMGGAVTGQGNITANAEFNIAVDPDAAEIVFSRWPDITLVDWEASVRFAPLISETENWFAGPSANARFMQRISRKTRAFKDSLGGNHWHWADPLAAYVAIQPDASGYQRGGISVLREGVHAGTTLINSRQSTHRYLSEINLSAFHHCMAEALA